MCHRLSCHPLLLPEYLPVLQREALFLNHEFEQADRAVPPADVRRSIHTLREEAAFQESLYEALRTLFRSTDLANGAQIEFVMHGRERSMTPQTHLSLYRVAQEGVTNVHKHASASFVEVHLHYEADHVA